MFFAAYAETLSVSQAQASADIDDELAKKFVTELVNGARMKGLLVEGKSVKNFRWNKLLRKKLINAWVNSGDIAAARDSIGCTAAQFFEEKEENAEFAEALERARPLAEQVMEDYAHQQAKAGNSQLLSKILAAKKPAEYRESVKVDVTHRVAGWNPQKERRLAQLKRRFGAIEGGAVRVLPAPGGAGEAPLEAQVVRDVSEGGEIPAGVLPQAPGILPAGG